MESTEPHGHSGAGRRKTMRHRAAGCLSVWLLVMFLLTGIVLSPSEASTKEAGNAACPEHEVFFDPGKGEDIFIPSGFKIEVFATGLDFPVSIAFRGTARL
jgi:hypothetical protein